MNDSLNYLQNLFCKHENSELVRWHWTHGINGMEPKTIEAEYKCRQCGKIEYLHLNRKESFEWAEMMGDFRKWHG